MKLLQFILGIIITLSSLCCSIFLFFYGVSIEDSVILLLSLFFLIISYIFSKIIDIKNNEYTVKIVNLIYNYFYKE